MKKLKKVKQFLVVVRNGWSWLELDEVEEVRNEEGIRGVCGGGRKKKRENKAWK